MDTIQFPLIAPSGQVTAADLSNAVYQVLRRFQTSSGTARLEGADALRAEWDAEHCELHIMRLVARTASGLRVEFHDERIPVSTALCNQRAPFVVGFGWDSLPTADGTVIETGKPTLFRVEHEAMQTDGALLLGYLSHAGFDRVPVPSDRCDSSPELQSWFTRMQDRLAEADRLATGVCLGLTRGESPVLVWCALLQPILSPLEEATTLAPSEQPYRLQQLVGRLLMAIGQLPRRVERMGDPEIGAMVSQLDMTHLAPAAEASTFAEHCADLESKLDVALAAVRSLARCVGFPLKELPDVLYQRGRLYRRLRDVNFERQRASDSCATYSMRSNCDQHSARVALLWDSKGRTVHLGDIRLLRSATNKTSGKRGEIFLGLPANGQYHWIEESGLGRATLEATTDLTLLDGAAYVPFFSR